MRKALLNNNHYKMEDGFSFYCDNCDYVGSEVIAEFWSKNSDGPHRIVFIQHENLIAKVSDEIDIKSDAVKNEIVFYQCGVCSNLIDEPIDIDHKNMYIRFFPDGTKN